MSTPQLDIRLLGELELRQRGTPLPALESARAESLLAYLLLHRAAPQPRQRLAFLLWPDSPEPQARTNLRHVLHTLRRALPELDAWADVGPRTLQWRADAPCRLDVALFEAALARARAAADDDARVAALREAVDAYAGDLLAGSYDEWVLPERERLRQAYLTALERLAALLEARGERAEAIAHAERLLRQDPLREATYRRLMRLHDARGDRARALRVYHTCAATLERELGVAPSAPTRETYEALLPEGGAPADGAAAGAPPLVGRARERAQLAARWQESARGRAQLVLVTGEAGVGKTRLVEELRSWCAHGGAAVADARAYPAEGEPAYGPVVAWLRAEPVRARRARLDRACLTELARLLPELHVEAPDLPLPEPLPEREQRQRLFDAVARALLAAGAPLLLVLDDAHWCDPETLRFVHYLLRADPHARLLVAATARREELDDGHPLRELLAALQRLDRCAELPLERLAREDTAALAERVTGRALPPGALDRLHGETEGNPLFVLEALRAGWHEGEERRDLGPRVQAVIESRLAQLSAPARELIGVAATIGREFTADVLADASGRGADDDAVVSALDELWRRRIVRDRGADAYDFTHDKLREVAYLALSPAVRRRHHLRVAGALERLRRDGVRGVGGQLAAHYERAGAGAEAIAWHERAAEEAQLLHASPEAIRHLDRALELLRARPATPERDARELALLTTLLATLGVVEGFGSARLAEAQRRTIDLARALGVELAPQALRSLAIASLSHGDFAGARRCAERLRARGERDGDDVLLVEAHYLLGIAAFWAGELRAARTHFEASIAAYRPEHGPLHRVHYGQDPKVVCQSRLANTLWLLGEPEAAARARDAALAYADALGHPISRGTALVFAGVLALEAGDDARLRECAAALTAQDTARDSRPNQTMGEAFRAYLDVLDGRREAGLARIRRMLDESGEVDLAPGHRGVVARVLLQACMAAGDARGALAAADRALAMGGGARIWEAELRRRRAECLAALGAPAAEVEEELARALAVARRQGARPLEQRAAASLARLRARRPDASAVG